MANTVRDAKTAALGAMMDIQLAVQRFAQEWTAPDIRRAQAAVEKNILTQWDAHEQEITAMQAENPDAHARANQQIQAIRDRNGAAITGSTQQGG